VIARYAAARKVAGLTVMVVLYGRGISDYRHPDREFLCGFALSEQRVFGYRNCPDSTAGYSIGLGRRYDVSSAGRILPGLSRGLGRSSVDPAIVAIIGQAAVTANFPVGTLSSPMVSCA